MRSRHTHIALFTGAMLVLSPALFAAPSTAKTQDETAQGARLMKSVAADAQRIESAATELEKLTKDPAASWQQFDRQWNELQPVVETMRIRIARLESMESSLSAKEKQALDQAKADCRKIAWRSRELGILVDKVPADLTNPKFKIESVNLKKEAGQITKTVKNGV